ncbi:MAG: zinc-ribbon domain-containing protein [Candidatus Hydrogenedentes bacterium]|nr:zinc-ribbon domain-containing protein [Candidatus Hydrogenedentota bacterium]
MLIIFGISNKATTVETGMFDCPVCRSRQRFARKHLKRYFAIFFIPLIPFGDAGVVVACERCRTQFPDGTHLT